jgi:hypothetical protein
MGPAETDVDARCAKWMLVDAGGCWRMLADAGQIYIKVSSRIVIAVCRGVGHGNTESPGSAQLGGFCQR